MGLELRLNPAKTLVGVRRRVPDYHGRENLHFFRRGDGVRSGGGSHRSAGLCTHENKEAGRSVDSRAALENFVAMHHFYIEESLND